MKRYSIWRGGLEEDGAGDWVRFSDAAELQTEIERLKIAQEAERAGNSARAFVITVTEGRIVVTDPTGDDIRAAYLLGMAAGMHGDLIAGSPFRSPKE